MLLLGHAMQQMVKAILQSSGELGSSELVFERSGLVARGVQLVRLIGPLLLLFLCIFIDIMVAYMHTYKYSK